MHWDAAGNQIPNLLEWWQDLCWPYVKNEKVYECPSASPHTGYTYWRSPGQPNPLIRDYIANTQWGFTQTGPLMINGINCGRSAGDVVAGPFTNNWRNDSISLAAIEDAAGTIAVFDGRFGYSEVWRGEQVDAFFTGTGWCAWQWNSPGAANTPACLEGHLHKRHNGGFVAAYIDGHAKWVRNSCLGDWTRRAGD